MTTRVIDIDENAPDFMSDIREFHRKFGLEYVGPPRQLEQELADFRYKFMMEELQEYRLAWTQNDKEKMLDGLVDLLYVAFGTAHLHGFNINEAWRRVQEANMKKVRAVKEEDSLRGSVKYDVVKPEGWTPPDLSDLVDSSIEPPGYKPPERRATSVIGESND